MNDLKAIKKENEKYISIPFDNSNGLYNQLKKSIKNYKTFVFVASDPINYDKNDLYSQKVFESFKLRKLNFKSLIVLDDRTKIMAEIIVKSADFLFLAGGDVLKQNIFLKEIGLQNLLSEFKGSVILGQSAGAMNLSENVFNYPENIQEIDKAKWLKGLGLIPFSIIPHFNGFSSDFHQEEFNLLHDSLLPNSKKHPFIGIKDGSHILVENKKVLAYGDIFLLKDGEIKRLCPSHEDNLLKENFPKTKFESG